MRQPLISFPRNFLLTACLALVFLFQCCKSDSSKSGSSSTNPAAAAGNSFRFRVEQDVNTLNMLVGANTRYSLYVGERIFQTLGVLDPASMELKPLLLKNEPAFRPIADGPRKGGVAYDCELLEQAAWDNGSPITGHDIAFTLKAIMCPLVPADNWKGFFEYLRDVEVDAANPRKFTVYFSQYYLKALETLYGFPIMPAYHYDSAGRMAKVPLADVLDPKKADALKKNADVQAFAAEFQDSKFANDKNSIVGSGAYRVEVLDPATGVVLVRKKDWWGDKALSLNPLLAAKPEKLVYRPVKDEAAAVTMLQNGDLDATNTLSPAKFLELKANPDWAKNYDFVIASPQAYNTLLVNTRKAQLSDRRVRQAIAHLIDYEYLINSVAKGMAQRFTSPVSPSKPYYNKDIKPYDFNIEKAKQLLAEAGWADTDGNGTPDKMVGGKKTDFTLTFLAGTTTEIAKLTVESIRESAKKAGIAIEVKPVDLQTFKAEIKKGNFDIALQALPYRFDSDDFYQFLHSESLAPAGDNTSGWANREADRLIDAIRNEPDATKRKAHYLAFQQVYYDDLPAIPLFAANLRLVISNRFKTTLVAQWPGFAESYFELK